MREVFVFGFYVQTSNPIRPWEVIIFKIKLQMNEHDLFYVLMR